MPTVSAPKTEERIETAIKSGGLELDLSRLGLKVVPCLPPELKQLRTLNLSSNLLQTLADEVCNLSSLVDLDLGNNQLSELPPGIGRLTSLKRLDVSENRLRTLPVELSACRNLTEMLLYRNKLELLFSSTVSFSNLIRLDLSTNRLKDLSNLPQRFPKVQELDLSYNLLERLPEGLGSVHDLAILNLSHNRIASVAELSSLGQLRELYVDNNRLTQTPDALLALQNLRVLSANGNPFGELPPQFNAICVAQLRDHVRTAVEAHTSGGPEPGQQYAAAPPWKFDFLLGVHGEESTLKLADLYYKSTGAAWPATLKFPDGSAMDLQGLSRKTAIGAVQEHANVLQGGQALLDLGSATSERAQKTSFVLDAVSRLAQTELIPTDPAKKVVEFRNENVCHLSAVAAASASSPVTLGSPPIRDINVTAHTLAGNSVTSLSKGETYRIRFQVGLPTPVNLATGNIAVTNVPAGGLKTHCVITSADIDYVPALSTCSMEKQGTTWIADFDMVIPESGSSDVQEIAVLGQESPANLHVTIYVTSEKGKEIYRELTINLAGAPDIVNDETSKQPEHTHLETTHEWTTPYEHIQVSFQDRVILVSTKSFALNMYDFNEQNDANIAQLKNPIDNVRGSLDSLRDAHSDYFENLDQADIEEHLHGPAANWKPYGWLGPDGTDQAHTDAFVSVQKSDEWRQLASDGYALYQRVFLQGL